jgi:hypothetical protein
MSGCCHSYLWLLETAHACGISRLPVPSLVMLPTHHTWSVQHIQTTSSSFCLKFTKSMLIACDKQCSNACKLQLLPSAYIAKGQPYSTTKNLDLPSTTCCVIIKGSQVQRFQACDRKVLQSIWSGTHLHTIALSLSLSPRSRVLHVQLWCNNHHQFVIRY